MRDAIQAKVFQIVSICAIAAMGSSRASASEYADAWVSVDRFSLHGSAASYASTATADGIFFGGHVERLGSSPLARNENIWLVRHSKDRGQTWKTVDEVPVGETDGFLHGSMASNKVTGSVFAAFAADGGFQQFRRSSDGGKTWRALRYPGRAPRLLASDSKGVLYAYGDELRRSVDDGSSWTAVPSIPTYEPFAETLIVTGKNGQVVFFQSINYSVVNIYFSVDGTDFRLIHSYAGEAHKTRISAANMDEDGNIVLAGHNRGAPEYRVGHIGDLRRWQAVAVAQGLVYEGMTRGLNGKYYTGGFGWGLFQVGEFDPLTGQAKQSDALEGGNDYSFGLTAVTSSEGDIFVGGKMRYGNGKAEWIVRMLKRE